MDAQGAKPESSVKTESKKSFYSVEGKGDVYTVKPEKCNVTANASSEGGGAKQKDKNKKEKKKENPKKTTEKVRVRSKNDQGKEKEVERVVYVGPRGGKYIKNKDGSFSLLRGTKK